jgi:hypothetical protein
MIVTSEVRVGGEIVAHLVATTSDTSDKYVHIFDWRVYQEPSRLITGHGCSHDTREGVLVLIQKILQGWREHGGEKGSQE